MSLLCYNCATAIAPTNLGRQDSCEKCGRDTRVCRNCKHFDRSSNNECREEQAGRQVEKEKANFCEWFQAREGKSDGQLGQGKDSMKAAAEALFKKK